MTINHFPIILLTLGGIILTVGDIAMKKWVNTNRPYFFIVGLLIYMIGMVLLGLSYRHKNIAEASVILVLVNIILLSLVSRFYFKEVWTIYEVVGILLALSLIAFLELTPP